MTVIMKRQRNINGVISIVLTVSLLIAAVPVSAAVDKGTDDGDMFLESTVALTKEEQKYLQEHPVAIMAADASWCPLEYLDDEGQYAGVIAEITKKIEGYTGLRLEYKVMGSYAEALAAVQAGEADLISGIANDETSAAEYHMILSDPYLTINSAVISKNELTNLYQGTEHKKIAVVADDYSNADIETRIANAELVECSSNEACLEMVYSKKADMAIIASYCAEHYLSIPKYSKLDHHTLPDFNWEQSFGVSEEADPLLVSILNKGIHAISQVDLNEAVYDGITKAEYENILMELVYEHPLLVLFVGFATILLIAVLLFIVYRSKKAEQMRKLQDGTRLRLALERTHLCIWEYDIATRRILQLDNGQEKHGFHELRENIPESVIEKDYIHPEDIKEVRAVMERVQNGEQDVQGCWRVREDAPDQTGTDYWWEQVLFHIVHDEHGRAVSAIGVSEDVTEEKNAQRDALTLVYNRSSFEQKAKKVLDERRNSYMQCAFLILDLDGFKQINDTYGHGTGDKVLIAVGATLNRCFRATDIIGRLGGDEFTVFLTSIRQKEDMMKKASELVENIGKLQEEEGFPFPVSCSVGVAPGVKGKDDLPIMYKKADLALYEAKNAGKNRYQIYEEDSKKRILVVDDIEMSRTILMKTLSAEYEVLEADNGQDALRILKETSGIDLVITDIIMPEMDGIELIKQIHADENLKHVAIVAETQAGDMKQEKEIMNLGVDDFIYKAASPGVIQMRVRNIMKSRGL